MFFFFNYVCIINNYLLFKRKIFFSFNVNFVKEIFFTHKLIINKNFFLTIKIRIKKILKY
jgi:hypothetical protein